MLNIFSKYLIRNFLGALLLVTGCDTKLDNPLPEGFVYLTNIDPSIIEQSRYATGENFLNKSVDGYENKRIICTKEAANKLKLVHADLKLQGYKLVVYDGYRPQRAVNEFISWSKDINDQAAKPYYYPTIDKRNVFKLGYVCEKSSHSRGSTFDLTLIKINEPLKPISYSTRVIKNGEVIPILDDNTVDMGSNFDLFHEVSHHDSPLINSDQTKMRNLLRNSMKRHGFKDYQEEWWHYTLESEPYPNTYFDFPIK